MPVNASGKNTNSAFLPRSARNVTGCPFWSFSVKSGASAPALITTTGSLRLRLDEATGDPVAEVRRRRLHQPRGGRRLGDLRWLYVSRLAGLGCDHPDDAVLR